MKIVYGKERHGKFQSSIEHANQENDFYVDEDKQNNKVLRIFKICASYEESGLSFCNIIF